MYYILLGLSSSGGSYRFEFGVRRPRQRYLFEGDGSHCHVFGIILSCQCERAL